MISVGPVEVASTLSFNPPSWDISAIDYTIPTMIARQSCIMHASRGSDLPLWRV